MLKLLLWIWQLPQNLVGLILTRGHCDIQFIDYKKVYTRDNFFNSGISLGNFIILDSKYLYYRYLINAVRHEYGHQRQSKYLGPLYLIIIGLPSLFGNIWDRVAHKNWSYTKRDKWYYNQPWEKWADKLGNVRRYYNEFV